LDYAHIIGFRYFIYPPEYVRALPRRSLFSYQITKSHKIQGLGFIGSFADAGQFANCFVLLLALLRNMLLTLILPQKRMQNKTASRRGLINFNAPKIAFAKATAY